MSLAIFWNSGRLTLISAFENGSATVYRLDSDASSSADVWTTTYRSQTHSQPILSLDVAPDLEHFFTSGADAVIAKHPIPFGPADDDDEVEEIIRDIPNTVGSLPTKTVKTKHAGQQSLRVRSDGRIFATAGWDATVRVYSTRTLKELAVLKWHQAGCYAVGFAIVDSGRGGGGGSEDAEGLAAADTLPLSLPKQLSVKDKRVDDARTAHWIAAGSKDGKISLWVVY